MIPRPFATLRWKGEPPLILRNVVWPLKIGIREDLRQLVADDVTNEELQNAIHWHCNTERYLRAMTAPNSARFDAAGRVVEPVTDEHRAFAQEKLDALLKRRRKRDAREEADRRKNVPGAIANIAKPKLTLALSHG